MSEWPFFQLWKGQYVPEYGEKSGPILANGKPLSITRETIDGKRYQVFSGPGAAEIARAVRDELRWDFNGSSFIP